MRVHVLIGAMLVAASLAVEASEPIVVLAMNMVKILEIIHFVWIRIIKSHTK